MNQSVSKIFFPLVSILVGVLFSLLIVAMLGESPLEVMTVLIKGAFGSATDFGYTLYYSTPVILTGLSVAWAGRVGLFNIGAEGQMSMGGVAMITVGLLFPNLPSWVAVPAMIGASFVAGGLWGALAGWFKAWRGCHEVLATILLNFVAYGILSYFTLVVFRNHDTLNPETQPLPPSFGLPKLSWIGGESPLNFTFIIAVIACLIGTFVLFKTVPGFHQRLAGASERLARYSGVEASKQIVIAMFVSGGVAALAATNEILGYALKLKEGFSSGDGFVGIAVALIARNHPFFVIFGGLLFGALHKGALNLDLDTQHVTRDLSSVIQAMIIIGLVSEKGLRDLMARALKLSLFKRFRHD